MESVEKFATARMVAERIGNNDFADLCRMNRDPQVAATMGGIRSESQTHGFLQDSIEHWRRHGYGFWTFRNREDGRFIGRAGLRHVVVEATPEIELAYAVMPDLWRKGIATEMSRAILEIATGLAIHDLVAFTMPTNLGSRGVMEKIGFTYERDITWANLPHVLCRKKL
jgi:[ribosomal protein S5]-alanine N-acetyltransferase